MKTNPWIGICLALTVAFTISCKGRPPAPPPPTPTPAPAPTATPEPTATPTPGPVGSGSLSAPNHPLPMGYYFEDGKYGDFSAEVDCYSDLYIVLVRSGYESSTDDTNEQWLPRMRASVNRAAAKGKKLYLNLNLAETDPFRKTPLNEVLDIMAPVWNSVKFIEMSDEPNWDQAETNRQIRNLRDMLRGRNLAPKPVGVVYTKNQILNEDAFKASEVDWVGIEAYVDAPGSNNSQTNIDTLTSWVNRAKQRIPADKNYVLVMQAYSRNFVWTNISTLAALQVPTYLLANEDPRAIALTLFAYGRPSGTFQYPELRAEHKKIGTAILNKHCP